MKKEKSTLVKCLICGGLLCVIWSLYFIGATELKQRVENVLEDELLWVAQVEEIRHEDGKYILEGFSFRLNRNADDEAFEIILMNTETGKYLFPKMEYVERKDVNEYFLCEYDYTKSGFIASINDRQLDFDEEKYEVLIRPKGTKDVCKFGNYLIKEEVSHVSPEMSVALNVKATDLEEIVVNGRCIMSCSDVGMSIYQHEEKLYWIAEKSYDFNINARTSIECMVATTQGSRLFGEEKKETRVNNGFIFEEKEVEGMNVGDYRVAITDIPNEYSITNFIVGDHTAEAGWIWSEPVRPWYEFE